ncbi:MAG TPA: hypothetical protein VK601_02940, partial [Kofleriaceae bacterium]|nr:hypothetical protein [Kofleriaceae bacterium]
PGSEPPADERARREPEPLSEARREPEPLSEARMLFDLPPPPELHGRLHVEPGEPDRKPTPDLALAELELRAPEYALRAPRRLVIVLAILAVLSVLGALVWWLAH